ncbi:MAG: hypothetical protein P4L36_07825 [Holophaga sp.]|nr:hypothetical protein [Holophaga sp.]
MAALANAQGTPDATQGTTQPADGQSPAPDKPSTLKSFAYGSLGLEHPDQQDKDPDTSYSVGRWLAAAVTAGTLVSLLV